MVVNYRFIVLALFLVVSAYLLLSPLILTRSGVLVTYVESGNECDNINSGGRITKIEQTRIKNIEDLNEFLGFVKLGEYYSILVDDEPGGCVAIGDGDLGFRASNLPSESLIFGIDIQGGTKTILGTEKTLTNSELNELVDILKRRADVLNLRESDVRVSDNYMEITTSGREIIENLLVPGKIEAKIEQIIRLDGGGTLIVGSERYDVAKLDTEIEVGGTPVGVGESFYLNNIKFNVLNVTNNSATIDALFFNNSDITDPQNAIKYVRYDPQSKMYQFNIFVRLSEEAGVRFANITKGLTINYAGTVPILDGRLKYYLDDKPLSELSIPFENAGEPLSDVSIMGFGKNIRDAIEPKIEVELALAGYLPIEFEIIRFEPTEPSVSRTLIMGVFAIVASISFFSLYASSRNIKSGVFSLFLLCSLIFCVLGIAAIVQKIFKPGWVLDVPSLAGLIVLLAFGTYRFMLVSKEGRLPRSKRWNYTPIILSLISLALLFSPFRGFGLAVIIGLIIEALVTMPLYVEHIKGE